MNTTGWFKTQDPAVVGPELEELVRRDVGSTAPLSYSVSGGANFATSVTGTLPDRLAVATGGTPTGLYNVSFWLPYPTHAVLTVAINRLVKNSYCGYLRYQVKIGKPVDGEVTFEKGKALIKGARFLGGESAAKLNAVPGLAKKVDGVLETKILVATAVLEVGAVFRLVPTEGGAWLMLGALPDQKMGFKSPSISTNAGEVLKIASAVEAAL